MRVVFDTNIFVSALAIPGGRAEEALQRVILGEDRLITSRALIRELLGVLARKFGRDREQLARVAVFLADLSEIVTPRRRLRVVRDDPDNRVLECALAGRAQAIVTGDRKLLELEVFQGIRIVSLAKYLNE